MSDLKDVARALEVEIRGLVIDPVSNSPIVILKKPNEDVFLPIWIGVFEANAIALELEGVQTPRPMTHGLLRDLIVTLGARVRSVLVHTLRENTFLARIELARPDGEVVAVDARPSDAIALALRCRAPIRVTAEVFEAATSASLESGANPDERVREWLDSLSPEQLGKYRM